LVRPRKLAESKHNIRSSSVWLEAQTVVEAWKKKGNAVAEGCRTGTLAAASPVTRIEQQDFSLNVPASDQVNSESQETYLASCRVCLRKPPSRFSGIGGQRCAGKIYLDWNGRQHGSHKASDAKSGQCPFSFSRNT
jgi:hypothetical protein